MRMIFPYWLISMTSASSVTCAMPTTLPLRSVVFTLITPLPPRLQAIFVGGGALAVSVFGDGKNQRTFLPTSNDVVDGTGASAATTLAWPAALHPALLVVAMPTM